MKMNYNTSLSIIVGLFVIFGAYILDGGILNSLFIIPALLIVVVGTIAAGSAGSTFRQIKNIPILIKIAFFPNQYNIEKLIKRIIVFSIYSRKEGILSLEDKLDEIENNFLKKLFQICIDGGDKKTLKEVFEINVNQINDRHQSNISFFNKLGGYSPTMGIIGTVMGLINTLAAAGGEPNQLIRHIATAFIATLWGILLANMLWFPIADKLKTLNDEELNINQIMFEGVYGIAAGEVPSVIQARLVSYFPSTDQPRINNILTELIKETSKNIK